MEFVGKSEDQATSLDPKEQACYVKDDPNKQVIQEMAQSGLPHMEWDELKRILGQSLGLMLDAFRKDHPGSDPAAGNNEHGDVGFNEHRQRLLSALELLQGAPFTLQRLCELILGPEQHYKSVKKLMFGLEKLLSVSSVLEVVPRKGEAQEKIQTEQMELEASEQDEDVTMTTTPPPDDSTAEAT